MRPARQAATTVALVLTLTGGCDPGPAAAPTVDADWVEVPDAPLEPRRAAVAAWVGDTFVVVGGWSDAACPPDADCVLDESAALVDGAAFDPATSTWRTIAPAPVHVSAGAPTAVLGRTLYIAPPAPGGDASDQSLLAYDASADTWSSVPAPANHPAQLVAAGEVLVALAGTDEYGPATDVAFSPASGLWTPLPDDPLGPSFDRSAVWTGDGLLLAAADLVPSPSSERPALVRLAMMDAELGVWSEPRETEVLAGPAAVVAGRVVFPVLGSTDGGEVNNWGRSYPLGGILDLETMGWSELPEAADADGPAPLPPVAVAGRVVVGHGLLDPVTGEWERLPGMPDEVIERAVAASEEMLFVWGGATTTEPTDVGYLLRP